MPLKRIKFLKYSFRPLPFRISQVVLVVKSPSAIAGETKDGGSIPGSEKIPRRRAWQPTPVFLPGEFHGQRSLVSYVVNRVTKCWTRLNMPIPLRELNKIKRVFVDGFFIFR